MLTAVIGDIHGRTEWKRVVEAEAWDRVVFIGDYFDTHDKIGGAEQLHNFNEIVEYAKRKPNVGLLVGNHDYHYLTTLKNEQYSGYQPEYKDYFWGALQEAKKLLQVIVVEQGWWISHAGVSNAWMKLHGLTTPADINLAWEKRPEIFRFNRIDDSGYGDHVEQGPLWIRPAPLRRDPAHDKQIVGHTRQKLIDCGRDIVLIDAMPKYYLEILDGDIEENEV